MHRQADRDPCMLHGAYSLQTGHPTTARVRRILIGRSRTVAQCSAPYAKLVAWHGMHCACHPPKQTLRPMITSCTVLRDPNAPTRVEARYAAAGTERRHRCSRRENAGGHRPRRAHPWSYRTAHTHARPRSPSTSSAPTLPALQAMRATHRTCTEYGPSVDPPLGHYRARCTPHNERHRRPVTHTQAQAVPSTLFNCREKRSVSTLARCHAKRRTLLQARP